MKYFEVFFDNGEDTDFTIACRGYRIPTLDEARVFCAEDAKMFGPIYDVTEICERDFYANFDTEDMNNKPIFGA